MEKTITITLADGTVLENLGVTGNNYISEEKIEDDVFNDEALERVEIHDSTTGETQILNNAALVQNIEYEGEYWFIFREKSNEEVDIETLNGAIVDLAEIIGEL